MSHRVRIAFAVGVLALGLAPLFAEEAPPVKERRIEVMRIHGPRGDGQNWPIGKGFLGVSLIELTPDLLDHFNVKAGTGVMVSHVETGSPADKAGIQPGDVVTEIDGEAVQSSWDVQRQIRHKDGGEGATIELWRGGKVQRLTATIAERERAEFDLAPMFLKRRDGRDVVLELDPERRGAMRDRLLAPGHGPRDGRAIARPRSSELEARMKELEKRIAELEKLLEKR